MTQFYIYQNKLLEKALYKPLLNFLYPDQNYPSGTNYKDFINEIRQFTQSDIFKDYFTYVHQITKLEWINEQVCLSLVEGISDNLYTCLNPLIISLSFLYKHYDKWRELLLFYYTVLLLTQHQYIIHSQGDSYTITTQADAENFFSEARHLIYSYINKNNDSHFLNQGTQSIPSILHFQLQPQKIIWSTFQSCRDSYKNRSFILNFTYTSAYDSLYKKLYQEYDKIYQYTKPYHDMYGISEPLYEQAKTREIVPSWLDFCNQKCGGRLTLDIGIIDVQMIAINKIFYGLSIPLTICTRIPHKEHIPLILIEELLHCVFGFNSTIYQGLAKKLTTHFPQITGSDVPHFFIYTFLDLLQNKFGNDTTLFLIDSKIKRMPIIYDLFQTISLKDRLELCSIK